MTECRTPMSPAALVDILDTFMSDNRHSRGTSERWLASIAEDFAAKVRHVRNGPLPPEIKQKISAFRAAELLKEMDEKQRELVQLERELKLAQRDAASELPSATDKGE